MEQYDEVVEVKRRPRADGHSSAGKSGNSKTLLESIDDSERTTTIRPASSLPRKGMKPRERTASDSESSDSATDENTKRIIEGFDYRIWENLDVIPEVKELYQYIAR